MVALPSSSRLSVFQETICVSPGCQTVEALGAEMEGVYTSNSCGLMIAAVAAGRGVASEPDETARAAKKVLVKVRRPNILNKGMVWERKDRRASAGYGGTEERKNVKACPLLSAFPSYIHRTGKFELRSTARPITLFWR